MRLKKLLLGVVIIIGLFLFSMYEFYINQIDTKYAIKFAKVFENYDIRDVDNYLSPDTQIICGNLSGTYDELRNNVIISCQNKKFSGESYGYGKTVFVGNEHKVKILLWGTLNNRRMGECYITMTLKKVSPLKYKIISIESNKDNSEQILKHIFF